eukprot:1344372-Pleurochrysis_carterae.AAC.1
MTRALETTSIIENYLPDSIVRMPVRRARRAVQLRPSAWGFRVALLWFCPGVAGLNLGCGGLSVHFAGAEPIPESDRERGFTLARARQPVRASPAANVFVCVHVANRVRVRVGAHVRELKRSREFECERAQLSKFHNCACRPARVRTHICSRALTPARAYGALTSKHTPARTHARTHARTP